MTEAQTEGANGQEQAPRVHGLDRDEAIASLRHALKARSGRAWSVTGGRGTAYGWIRVHSPPAGRSQPYGYASDADAAFMAEVFGGVPDLYRQGHSIPASSAYRLKAIQQAKGEPVTAEPKPDWD